MKLKYYLRGLGIGLAVTSILFTIYGSLHGQGTMTDEQVIARAYQLGMVETSSMSLTDASATSAENEISQEDEAKKAAEEEAAKKAAEEEAAKKAAEEEAAKKAAEEAAKKAAEEEAAKKAAEEEAAKKAAEEEAAKKAAEEEAAKKAAEEEAAQNGDRDTVTVTVKSGMGSYSVAKALADAGVVDSASEFDKFLCDNDYSKVIRVGTYKVPVDATYKEIAKILTGKN